MRLLKSLFTVIASMTLASCATSMPPSNPMVLASCPNLAPLTDPSFGATVRKLVEVAGQYNKCRTAALGNYRGEDKAK